MIEQLLILGDPSGMEEVVQLVIRKSRNAIRLRRMDDVWEQPLPADFLLVLQHWPDEYAPDDIEELLEAYPLSRLTVVEGVWCASSGRTRQGWPAAVRVTADQLPARLHRELAVLDGRLLPLPWTAGLDEIFAFDQLDPDMIL